MRGGSLDVGTSGTAAGDPPDGPNARLPRWARALVLLVFPLLFVGPALRPEHRFLPQAPVQFEPLASEHPERAAAAERGSNRYTGDRVFPALSDQIELRRRLVDGESWTWEPKWGLGAPLLGNAIHGPFYPPNLLALAVPPDRAAAPLAIATLFLAGLGAWCFLARRELGEMACAVAALAYQATGWGVVNLHYPMKVDAALWLPWGLVALDAWRRGDRRALPRLALVSGLALLTGFPPIAGFALAGVGVVALVWALGDAFDGRPARAVVAGVAGPAAAIALGAALAAVQLVPTASALAASPRSAATPTSVAAQTLPGAALALAAVPSPFGPPTVQPPPHLPLAAWIAPAERGDAALAANGLEWNTHAGVVAFALAAIGFVVGGRRALAPFVLLATALAWAFDWPGARLLYHLPGLNGGLPTRALAVAWFAWVWAAALGVDRLTARDTRRSRNVALGVTATLAGLALGARAALPDPERFHAVLAERHGLSIEAVRSLYGDVVVVDAFEHLSRSLLLAATVFALLAAGVAMQRISRPRRARALGAAALVAIAIEAVLVSRVHLLPRHVGDGPLFPQSPALAAVARTAGEGRVLRWAPNGLGDVIQLARPNMLQVYGVRDITSYLAFQPRATARWFAAIDPRFVERGEGVAALPALHLLDDPRLDEAGITCILSVAPIEHERLTPTYSAPNFHVYRRRNELAPSAWIVEPPVEAKTSSRQRAVAARRLGLSIAVAAALAWVAWFLLARRRQRGGARRA